MLKTYRYRGGWPERGLSLETWTVNEAQDSSFQQENGTKYLL